MDLLLPLTTAVFNIILEIYRIKEGNLNVVRTFNQIFIIFRTHPEEPCFAKSSLIFFKLVLFVG